MKLGMCIGSNVYNMHVQHLGRYLEGQGHSLTLQQDRVRFITLLFDVGFYNYFRQTTSVSNTNSGSITRFRPALVIDYLL